MEEYTVSTETEMVSIQAVSFDDAVDKWCAKTGQYGTKDDPVLLYVHRKSNRTSLNYILEENFRTTYF